MKIEMIKLFFIQRVLPSHRPTDCLSNLDIKKNCSPCYAPAREDNTSEHYFWLVLGG